MIVLHTYTIFNADAHSTEVSRVRIRIWYIETSAKRKECQYSRATLGRHLAVTMLGLYVRFDGDALAGFQWHVTRLAWSIVHIKANVVAQMVGKECLDSLEFISGQLQSIQNTILVDHQRERTLPDISKPNCERLSFKLASATS